MEIDGRAPMAHPPGNETRARPQRATSGPRTSVEARMVLTSSYDASGAARVRGKIVVRVMSSP